MSWSGAAFSLAPPLPKCRAQNILSGPLLLLLGKSNISYIVKKCLIIEHYIGIISNYAYNYTIFQIYKYNYSEKFNSYKYKYNLKLGVSTVGIHKNQDLYIF